MKYIVGSLSFLVLLLCLSVFIFDPTNLYYEFLWLDIPMHILGGIGLTSFFIALASLKKKKISLARLMVLYMIVAVFWEGYEFMKDMVIHTPFNGVQDTLTDIVNGAVGVLIAYFFTKK